ncbi:MAG: sulfur-carrier protein adenylyltransferase/sulfurtransferase [Acidimicrobiaceae bacterium]|jgi:molybdopterin/thiamine biosynthesis adenylyltransferase/rhodanese-related sulfurtransferase|nr:sulfur-carrier protein adenylyltransferase/sulfurtransferase [Acidimicrobiaceae bacterium]
MPSFRDLLKSTKANIREVDTAGAAEAIAKPGTVVLDVREADEYEQGALPGAVHIPRGFLESQVEGKITDHGAPVVVYCAGGVRSAFAAETLQQLGYTDVVSMDGGFNRWKDEGRDWRTPAALTADQRNRYQRHILLPEVDVKGQQKLLDSKVLLIGAGGLGSPAALYLAAAGVGTLGIIDMDVVDASNLQRQILHNMDRIGERKVDSAKKTLTGLNPDVNVVTYDVRLGADNVLQIFQGYDVIIDGTDNFPTRYLVNDASLKLDIPVVHGSIFRFEGQASVYLPHQGPCYRCQVPEPPPAELAPSCAEAGVLGVLPGIIGSIQAMEALKLLLGLGEPLAGRLLAYDALEESFRTFKVPRDPECAACSIPKEDLVIAEYDQLCMPHPIAAPANA